MRKHSITFKCENGKSLTKSEFKNECDINLIVKRFDKTGLITHVSNMSPIFGDFINPPT